MAKRMLIDATHPEETRVVVMSGNRLEEFDFESENKKQLKGNIYLAKVTRVEPSLQAAFIDYGGNRHGFLAFSEVHPDYYRIPIADREKLLRAEQEAAIGEEPEEPEDLGATEPESAAPTNGDAADRDAGEESDEDGAADERAEAADSADDSGAEAEAAEDTPSRSVETLDQDDEDDFEQSERRKRASHRRYRIQEVISRRQILLVQVTKEERGTKGAALTTYISLAGRYCVLMPNTPKGGGISRKISNAPDRKRLKTILDELKIPDGMAVIVRTAGAQRTKAEIRRDYDYLIKLWDDIREKTLSSTAPALVHEEANLIKRSMRDLYSKDIDEILVEGEEGYRAAKDFMKTLTPSHAKKVQSYKDQGIPLFQRYQIEGQIDNIHSPVVQLKSGGYIVMNSTEALVAIDVNSGRSTRERNIEETAYRTNLEAADEVARQLRLRDLAGLIVIDFIDMEDYRNRHNVERRLKEAMRSDRARIQIGRISAFGLLEMSRQRLRPSVLEASSSICKHCGGSGVVRSTESTALTVLRAVEEEGTRHRSDEITVHVPAEVALYMLNQKRDMLVGIEERYGFTVLVTNDDTLIPPEFRIEVTEVRAGSEDAETAATAEAADDGSKRRRSRRGGRKRRGSEDEAPEAEARDEEKVEQRADREKDDEQQEGGERKGRRRGRRGGRRRRRERDDAPEVSAEAGETAEGDAQAAEAATGDAVSEDAVTGAADTAPVETEATSADAVPAEEAKPARRARRSRGGARKKAEPADSATETAISAEADAPAEVEETAKADGEAEAPEADAKAPKPRRKRAAAPRRASRAAKKPAADEAGTEAAAAVEEGSSDGEFKPEPEAEPASNGSEPAQAEAAEAEPAHIEAEPAAEPEPREKQKPAKPARKRTGWWNLGR